MSAAFPRVRLTVLRVGHCVHPECLALRGGAWRLARFPALVGLVRHPATGAVLFDTGYSAHFERATARLPERLYRWTTPVTLPAGECLETQLAAHGLALHEIAAVFASHLHADHVAGLRDLPRSAIWCSDAAVRQVRSLGRFSALRRATLKALLPEDFAARHCAVESRPARTLPGRWAMLGNGFDLLGDGSLWAVPLPGHARGQMGLLLRHDDDREYLLAADAAWRTDDIRLRRPPTWPARLLVDDWRAQCETLARLHAVSSSGGDAVCLLPSHCAEGYRALPDDIRGTP